MLLWLSRFLLNPKLRGYKLFYMKLKKLILELLLRLKSNYFRGRKLEKSKTFFSARWTDVPIRCIRMCILHLLSIERRRHKENWEWVERKKWEDEKSKWFWPMKSRTFVYGEWSTAEGTIWKKILYPKREPGLK